MEAHDQTRNDDVKSSQLPGKAPSAEEVRSENLVLRKLSEDESSFFWNKNGKVFAGRKEVQGADLSSFQYFERARFGKDKSRVYWLEMVVQNADPKTFQVVSHNGKPTSWGRDARAIYFGTLEAKGMNAKSFRIVNPETSIARDDVAYYAGPSKIPLDPKSFKDVGASGLVKDDSQLLMSTSDQEGNRQFQALSANDVRSFEYVGWSYFKDQKNAYHLDSFNPKP